MSDALKSKTQIRFSRRFFLPKSFSELGSKAADVLRGSDAVGTVAEIQQSSSAPKPADAENKIDCDTGQNSWGERRRGVDDDVPPTPRSRGKDLKMI